MTRRQTLPQRWFIVTGATSPIDRRQLPLDCGLLLLPDVLPALRARLRRLARKQGLTLIEEDAATSFRIHNMRELRRVLGRRSPIILISPINATRSHPDWQPIPRMRAAALARLAHRKAIALGGMNAERYAKVAPLGFIGWAGVSAFRI